VIGGANSVMLQRTKSLDYRTAAWDKRAAARTAKPAFGAAQVPIIFPLPSPRRITMAATGAETLKSTVEQFTTAGNQAFKDSIEKSLGALGEMNTHSKKNMEAMVASVTAATKGAEALGAQAMAYSKKSMEDQVAAAKSLTTAKSVQEVVELQTAWAKSAMEAYIAELNKASEIVAASVKDSFSPINERVTALVEKIQAAH
jgi:phasin family protein